MTTDGSAPEARGRTDASVSLLASIVDTALDPEYARQAEARGQVGPDPSAPAQRRRVAGPVAWIALVVIGLVIGVAIADVRATVVPQARVAQDALADRVRDRVALTDAAAAQVAALTDQIRDLTLAGGAGEENPNPTALEQAAASTPLDGEGVRIVLDDAEGRGSSSSDDEGLGRVLDRDLQLVANGLWAAGAEGVAINGRRLTSTSAIRSAGEAILVDYRPLAPPYVVEAVGDSDQLRSGFESGPAGLALRTLSEAYGLRFESTPESALSLPAGSIPVLRSATPLPPRGETP